MNFTDIPSRILKAFGLNGLKNTIPTESTTSTENNGVATYDKGFPSITMQPLSAGGIPPSGKDMNGILYALSLKSQWADAGMSYTFNSDFSTAISGYPKGSRLNNSGMTGQWLNTIDGNTNNPESSTGADTGWVPDSDYGVTNITASSNNIVLSSLQASKERIVLSGALTSNISLIFPPWMKYWTVVNNCSGSFNVICRTVSGTGVSIAAGGVTEKLYCDGLNIVRNFGTASQRNVGDSSLNIPDMSFFTSLKSTTGYQMLPGGLIIQWGQTGPSSATTGIASATFSTPFPNACLSVMLTEQTEIAGGTPYTGVNCWGLNTTLNKTGFQATCANRLSNTPAAAEGASYLAIGY
ncbi:hypothetical protein SNN70_004038 [Cronobacter malonaticus]|nr:hypothetical protein [Cronobacter malonaticus]